MVLHKKHVPIDSFGKICRTCLLAKEICSVFEVSCGNVSIVDMLEKFTFIQVNKEDDLPKNMCQVCIELLCQSYNFLQMCLKSNNVLEEVLKSTAVGTIEKENCLIDCEVGTNNVTEKIIIKIELDDSSDDIIQIDDDGETSCTSAKEPIEDIQFSASTEKQFSCELCLFSCETEEELNIHYTTVAHDNTLLICSFCNISCETKDILYNHLRLFHSSTNISKKTNKPFVQQYKCTLCEFTFTDSLVFECHLKKFHEKRMAPCGYNCNPCSMSFKDIKGIVAHYEEMHIADKKCIICRKVFQTVHFMKYHLNKHDESQKNCCDSCRQFFDNSERLQEHLQSDEHLNPKKCTICNKVFKRRYIKKVHMRTHTKEKLYHCKLCNEKFSYLNNLNRHLKRHAGHLNLCFICGKSFTTQFNLNLHMNKHYGVKSGHVNLKSRRDYICELCGMSFKTNQSLTNHLQSHEGLEVKVCRMCRATFETKAELDNHLGLHKKFKCNQCDQAYIYESNLQYHLRKHEKDMEAACPECGKLFKNKNYLKYHMFKHTGAKPYSCSICGKVFRQPAHLKTHQALHNGLRPYACLLCDKAFLTPSQLKVHVRVHTGEKPFKCPECDKAFHDASLMKRHRRRHFQQNINLQDVLYEHSKENYVEEQNVYDSYEVI